MKRTSVVLSLVNANNLRLALFMHHTEYASKVKGHVLAYSLNLVLMVGST